MAPQEVAEEAAVHSSGKEWEQLQLGSPDNVTMPTNGLQEGTKKDLPSTRQAPEHHKGHIG